MSVLIFGLKNEEEAYYRFINNNNIIIVCLLTNLYTFDIYTYFYTIPLKITELVFSEPL